ncbi:hypothetical protein KY290_020712 [Solanum tuberosum]|uniref:Uncharacterized protein n=2 Tax=Solanum tuberosum TaxID=4113 RepID=A0ABQ7UZF6_SOLTU|nr:hypothetical protein KY284_019697 [Solanum tuberosum]KAH0692598.1 hypothetical protein KY285_019695 [Solanum tuberosum]KAH0757219.1 hypothetical protein KY290_020712 [Solanum tuberosum]
MAEFIEDTNTKNKNKDPSISLVSDGKSSNEPSKNDQVVETQPENSTQNQEKENIIAQQGQEEEEEMNANDEERANFSTPPGKRSAPKPKTG